jgi:hypothetical protein
LNVEGAPTKVCSLFKERSTLFDVTTNRKKGAYQQFRKESVFLVSSEEVSNDISFFVFSEGRRGGQSISC